MTPVTVSCPLSLQFDSPLLLGARSIGPYCRLNQGISVNPIAALITKLSYGRFLFKVWATGQWKIGECVIVFQFSLYMLWLSFLVSVLSFSNQKTFVTNPMSILYISPMTDKKNHVLKFRVRGD